MVTLEGVEPALNGPWLLSEAEDGADRVQDLDLRAVAFVCPLDLVAIAAWSTRVPETARGAVLIESSPAASYMERMRLLSHLREAGWTVPAVDTAPWEDLPDRLLELTPLMSAHDVEDLADRLPRLWAGRTGDPKKSRALHFAFGELSDNAMTHSGDTPVFVAAQRFTGATSPHPARLELAVGDAGIGIPEHLRSNPSYASVAEDRDAILRALQPGVTGTRDRRGYGFHDILNEVGDVGVGELVAISGRGVVVAPIGHSSRRRVARPLPGRVRGTWVQVRLLE